MQHPADDGIGLHVEVRGAGEPVLLVHGLGQATWVWTGQVDILARGHRVIAFDHRGSGRSGKPAGPYSIAMLARDAAAVLRANGGAAHVVGASMGGYVALTLATRHPELVRSLVLIATSWGGAGAVGVPEPTTREWSRWAGSPAERYARETMPLSFAAGWPERHPDEFAALLRARLRCPTPPACWQAQYQACEEFLATGAGPGPLACPALVVHGTEDRVVPYANAASLLTRLPRGRLVTLHGAGHLCWLERPAEVADLIEQHIATHPAGPRHCVNSREER